MSGLIFVALAVAWALYLIPKAIRHHDETVRGRSVERFSTRMRVLARRDVVDRRNARLVVTPARAPVPPVVTTKSPSTPVVSVERGLAQAPVDADARRRASIRRATKRRRTVLLLLLVANVTLVGLGATAVVGWSWSAIPAGLLVAWLVACRLMVRSERGMGVLPVRRGAALPALDDEGAAALDDTGAIPVVPADAPADPNLWDPLPMQLPTYVNQPAARRTVRTIDLDSTGVWTSGRTESDAAVAREAHEADRADRARRDGGEDDHRAVGS